MNGPVWDPLVFLERLELRDVTLVQNDHVAALALVVEHPERVGRLVISSCELFENYPPGLAGKNLRATAMMPGGIWLGTQLLRVRALRRLPNAYGWLSKRPLPDDLVDGWLEPPQTQRAVRCDLKKYAARARRRTMLELCEQLPSMQLPTLVVWTPEDRVARPDHGRRLAAVLPHATLVEIADSYTLIARDQPQAFARAIRKFLFDQHVAPTTG
jgi:pimeloyl-ACP methyl ester carboxylesterase